MNRNRNEYVFKQCFRKIIPPYCSNAVNYHILFGVTVGASILVFQLLPLLLLPTVATLVMSFLANEERKNWY